jgi:hypothetical protein
MTVRVVTAMLSMIVLVTCHCQFVHVNDTLYGLLVLILGVLVTVLIV